MSRIWWQRSGRLWVWVVVGLRHGGCGFESWWVKGIMVVGLGYGGSMVGGAWWVRHGRSEALWLWPGPWWVYDGWGVVSHGGAVMAWGYGLWVSFGCCCCCCYVCVCVCVCVCVFSLGGGVVFVADVWWYLVVCVFVCVCVCVFLVGGSCWWVWWFF